MLKISIASLVFLISTPLFSQQKSDFSDQNNELKLNLVTSALALPEISYERILSNKIALGISASYSFEKKGSTSQKYAILPYVRLYLGKKRASGFFIEANMISKTWNKIATVTDILDPNGKPIGQNITTEPAKNLGFGGALGVKLPLGNSWLTEIFIGGGPLMTGPLTEFPVYPRAGISIGKRF